MVRSFCLSWQAGQVSPGLAADIIQLYKTLSHPPSRNYESNFSKSHRTMTIPTWLDLYSFLPPIPLPPHISAVHPSFLRNVSSSDKHVSSNTRRAGVSSPVLQVFNLDPAVTPMNILPAKASSLCVFWFVLASTTGNQRSINQLYQGIPSWVRQRL